MTLKNALPYKLSDYDLHSPLDSYLLYARMSTKAPSLYSKVMWCQMTGHALGWDAINLIQPSAVHHNSFGCLVGQSTLTNKSTAQMLGKNTYPRESALPDETSPEQFVVEMSEQSQRIWWMGELSRYIKGITGRGYMASFTELLNDLLACPEFYQRKLRAKKGEPTVFDVDKAYLTISSTITPEVLEEKINRELAQGGWLYRWLMVPGEGLYEPRKRLDPKIYTLRDSSKNFFRTLKEKQSPISFVLSDEALEKYNELEEAMLEKNTSPFVGRYFNYLISFADTFLVDDYVRMSESGEVKVKPLYSCDTLYEFLNRIQLDELDLLDRLDRLDTSDNLIGASNPSYSPNPSIPSNFVLVDAKYIERAWEIIEPCLNFSIQLVDGILLDRAVRALRSFMIKNKDLGWIDRSNALRLTANNAKGHASAVATLKLREEIEVQKYTYVRKNNAQTQSERYKWIGDSVQVKEEHKSKMDSWACEKCGTVVAYGTPTNINGKKYCRDCAKKVVSPVMGIDV